MLTEKNLKETCELFNRGLLKVQDAIAFGLNSYALNCKAGKVLEITREKKTATR